MDLDIETTAIQQPRAIRQATSTQHPQGDWQDQTPSLCATNPARRRLPFPAVLDGHFIMQKATVHMDYIAEALARDIQAYRLLSYDNFALHLRVHSAEYAKELRNAKGTFIGYRAYMFDQWGTEKRMDVQVRCANGVQVKYMKKWVPVSEYMKNLERLEESVSNTVQWRYEHQWMWWKSNGKTFRFLALPQELRELIYWIAFGPVIQPYPTAKARRLPRNFVLPAEKKPGTSMLRLNRQTAMEAKHMLYLYSTFSLQHRPILGRLIRNPSTAPLLRKVELELSHYDFLKLFGARITEDISYEPGVAAMHIADLELKLLTLKFAPPSLNTEQVWLDGACQRIVTSWILDSAWKWVRGHPVQVSGYIKNSQKRTFEADCITERNKFESWRKVRLLVGLSEGTLAEYHEWLDWMEGEEDGGVRVDGAKNLVVEERLLKTNWEFEFPPTCWCFPKCTPKTWVGDD
jgi:hypothetical protein